MHKSRLVISDVMFARIRLTRDGKPTFVEQLVAADQRELELGELAGGSYGIYIRACGPCQPNSIASGVRARSFLFAAAT